MVQYGGSVNNSTAGYTGKGRIGAMNLVACISVLNTATFDFSNLPPQSRRLARFMSGMKELTHRELF
jgi:hypothetical protein